MKGYYKNPEATATAIVDGGWCRTGDLASMDADGYVNIRGGLKDVIIRGGEKISPVEIEDVLYAHPKVQECALVGIPDARWGEEVMAFLRLRAGETATDLDFAACLEPRLAYHTRPKVIRFVEAFPAVPGGKIQKLKLREMAIEELGLREVAAIQTA